MWKSLTFKPCPHKAFWDYYWAAVDAILNSVALLTMMNMRKFQVGRQWIYVHTS
jgi:pyruvate/2-oxoglutarate/acetoin dehydrogenase E1 component